MWKPSFLIIVFQLKKSCFWHKIISFCGFKCYMPYHLLPLNLFRLDWIAIVELVNAYNFFCFVQTYFNVQSSMQFATKNSLTFDSELFINFTHLTALATWYNAVKATNKLTLKRLQFLGVIASEYLVQMTPVTPSAADWLKDILLAGRDRSPKPAKTSPWNGENSIQLTFLMQRDCLKGFKVIPVPYRRFGILFQICLTKFIHNQNHPNYIWRDISIFKHSISVDK